MAGVQRKRERRNLAAGEKRDRRGREGNVAFVITPTNYAKPRKLGSTCSQHDPIKIPPLYCAIFIIKAIVIIVNVTD